MTNDPDTKNKETPDQTSRKESGGSSTAGAKPKSPASTFPVGDPARRDFGDRTDDESKRENPSRRNTGEDAEGGRLSDPSKDDAGEGHKGPRAETKTGPASDRTQGDRSHAGQQRNDKSKPRQGDDKSGPHGGDPTKNPGSSAGGAKGGGGR